MREAEETEEAGDGLLGQCSQNKRKPRVSAEILLDLWASPLLLLQAELTGH